MEHQVIHCRRRSGGFTEVYDSGSWKIHFESDSGQHTLTAYSLDMLDAEDVRNEYNGMTAEYVLQQGEDILGQQMLAQGEPDYETVRRLLPPVTNKAFCFLSGAASWGGVVVDPQGQVMPQSNARIRQMEVPIFSPVMTDGVLGEMMPKQFLLDGRFPLLFSVHSSGNSVLEFLYFVEPGDPDRDPIVWIRTKRYQRDMPQCCTLDYQIAAYSRRTGRKIEKDTFLTAMADTIAYWLRFESRCAELSIPEKKLQNTVYGTMMSCATTFTGDHAHYGHLWYGSELHDNFPPNYIWSLEACCLMGQHSWAKRILQHLIVYVLNDQGRFVYRQGEHEIFGASAEEYGQLLFVIDRYRALLGQESWPEEYYETFAGMGETLLENCVPCPEYGGRSFIRMCAEADTNTRVHVYLNNNLWAIRGLQALARLLDRPGYVQSAEHFQAMADMLMENISSLSREYAEDSKFGKLVPFRFGYTAKPLTLSTCNATFEPVDEATLRRYLIPSHERHSQGSDQDLTENTYANYRYYPEILSAMLLDPEQADAIVRMREAIGGECLAMTRFYSWVDDWPVAHYARYLLETGRIEKYILLLYAHTAHHGHPDLMCYYEQMTIDGTMMAPDCVPSLLTSATLTAWMFAYETVADCRLQLLSAVPKAWFAQGFAAKDLGYSGGACSIEWDTHALTIQFSQATKKSAVLIWRLKENVLAEDITEGAEFVERIEGDRIYLKPGITAARLVICGM